jgi:hypothetical protein
MTLGDFQSLILKVFQLIPGPFGMLETFLLQTHLPFFGDAT